MIIELTSDDIQQAKAIFYSYPHHFNKLGLLKLEEEMIDYVNNPDFSKRCFFVEKESHQVLGVIGYSRSLKNPYEFEVTWLAVRADFKRKGIGKRLIEHLEERVKGLFAEILVVYTPDDIGSISFYEKMGFTQSGELSSDNKIGYKKTIKVQKPTFRSREMIGIYER
ncbi:MAG: GNAT family N-acetyltransferase [bacterium]